MARGVLGPEGSSWRTPWETLLSHGPLRGKTALNLRALRGPVGPSSAMPVNLALSFSPRVGNPPFG
eukprot:9477181-Pyramimonas_sp.AAC.1